MQALIETSRSISQDKLLKLEKKKNYDHHVRAVQNISSQKSFPTVMHVKQVSRLTKTLYKSKEAAKSHQKLQQKNQVLKQNIIMIKKIANLTSGINTENNFEHLQHKSGSNWLFKKMQAQKIKDQNVRIANMIMNTRTDLKQYKKKLGEDIREYLELKKKLRKCNYSSDKKERKSRAQSERKLGQLKLDEDKQKKLTYKLDDCKKSENPEKKHIRTQTLNEIAPSQGEQK